MNSPSFYVLLPTGAFPVSGFISCRRIGNNSYYVCFSPKKGFYQTLFRGADEKSATLFLSCLLGRMKNELPNAKFPLIDMRDFKSGTVNVGVMND